MTSKELNLNLVKYFPEIKDVYIQETSWQDGDDTGSHVVYADIFVPFIKSQIAQNNKVLLVRIFKYIEQLLTLNNEYINEVVALSVLESLLFDEDVDNAYFMQFVHQSTLQLITEIIKGLGECN